MQLDSTRWTARDSNPVAGVKSLCIVIVFKLEILKALLTQGTRLLTSAELYVSDGCPEIAVGGPSLIARNINSCISRSAVMVGSFLSATGNGRINYVGTRFEKKGCAEMHSSRRTTKNSGNTWFIASERHHINWQSSITKPEPIFQLLIFTHPHPPQFATGRTVSLWRTR